MTRVKRGVAAHRRHKKILTLAKGYRAARRKLFKTANEAVMRGLAYSYRHRRERKRDFHRLWIVRINAAARVNGVSYSKLILNMGEISTGLRCLRFLHIGVVHFHCHTLLQQLHRKH